MKIDSLAEAILKSTRRGTKRRRDRLNTGGASTNSNKPSDAGWNSSVQNSQIEVLAHISSKGKSLRPPPTQFVIQTRPKHSYFNTCTVLCLAIAIVQDAILDLYLSNEFDFDGTIMLFWGIHDVLIHIILLIGLISGTALLEQNAYSQTDKELPLLSHVPWICWAFESCYLISKIVAISFAEEAADHDHSHYWIYRQFLGPVTLRTIILFTGGMFIFYVHNQHDATSLSSRMTFINFITGRIVMDYMDAVDLLGLILPEDEDHALEDSTGVVLIVTTCIISINLLMPVIRLVMLRKCRYGFIKSVRWKIFMLRTFFRFTINLLNALLRLYVWFWLEETITVFLIKNVLMVVTAFHEYQQMASTLRRDSLTTTTAETTTTTAHKRQQHDNNTYIGVD